MTKIISISDEAYEELKRIKDGMSFTNIILDITKERKKSSIMELAGAWKDIDTDKIKEEIYKERKIGSRRFK
jgi:predicted CopG family antitoxin